SLKYPKSRIEYLSVKYSFTPQMIKILMQYDFCEELLESLNSEPKTSLRINSLKCSELHIDGVEIEKNPLYEYAVTASGFDVTASNEYKEGKFIAQDVAAMMASLALAPKENDVCIDVCAAPGGKTTHIAELMHNKGKITAFDIHPHKVDIIKKNAERMGISIIDAVCADASEYIDKYKETADKVRVDAPCSGLGIIRRKPDIKWQKENTEELPLLQYSILENAASYLKPGGELVYSTCTLDKKENEDVILEFVKNNNEFELTEIHIPGSLARKNDGFITFFPHIDNVDGFFISKIKRCN
ncbi:MAG: 16S rRNA (cytosine(967)-C(5))-methyltransferase RsmB, partial [Firmicutes bacterium]|nr:16S rRNA (cytosine(967)-C(5))-methyltransferase RsmB [Bacillota bacterium]